MTETSKRIELTAECLVEGRAQGDVLFSDVGLSFWGGLDPVTGEIIDRHHPLSGQVITGKILVIPGGRGSCAGSSVMLETILNGNPPAAMIFERIEDILTLGVVIAEEIFGKSLPVVCLSAQDFSALRSVSRAEVHGDRILFSASETSVQEDSAHFPEAAAIPSCKDLQLTSFDQELLEGKHGVAAQRAMRIIQRMAILLGAKDLIDVTRGHIDGCVYTGPASLAFARKLCDWGARVRIPTTMNSISVDKRLWRKQGMDPALGEPASALADAYVQMGAKPTFTCAPYLLDVVPAQGEQIVWAESNAVVYANSVLGARTLKYPDYLDIAIALTGRAPCAGCHVKGNRSATMAIELPDLETVDDSFYPLLGYHVGGLAGSRIPVILGIDRLAPRTDDLKAFSAAFATTSSAPMFHMLGVTPEAATIEDATGASDPIRPVRVEIPDLLTSWQALNSATEKKIEVVALGNPHFSYTECIALAELCRGRQKNDGVEVIVTCGRTTLDLIAKDCAKQDLDAFGVQFVTDTCWCMIIEPLLPVLTRTIMTNSAKYAHYGPGLVGRPVHFASLAKCVEAACGGSTDGRVPDWLNQSPRSGG